MKMIMNGKNEQAMKKINLILMALCVAAVSCTKDELRSDEAVKPETDKVETEEVYQGAIPMEFRAVTDETKTAIGDLIDGKRSISWEAGDEIKVIWAENNTVAAAASSGATTTFSANVDEADAYYAVYPASATSSLAEGAVTVTIPATQDVRAGFNAAHYAVAKADADNNLAFKNICGWLKFTISDPAIKRVLVRGNGEQNITGKVTVTFDETGNIASTAVSGGNNRLIVDVDGAGDYYVAVLPGMDLANGVGFRFYTDHSTAGDKAIETGVFNAKPLAVEGGAIVNLGDINSRIVKDWYIAPTAQGTGDGKSAANAAAGVEFLRNKLAQDETNENTADGLAKGYGCIGITIHAAAGEYDFAGEEIKIAWPGHTSFIGTTIEGVGETTVFKNTGASRFFNLGKNVALTLKNLKVIDGDASGYEADAYGGVAILTHSTATLELNGCVLDGNKASNGGAIYSIGVLKMENTTFSNNNATNGGAIYAAGPELTAKNTTFSTNESTTAGGAVGIAVSAETVTLTDCDFTSNKSGNHGGAFQNFGGENTVITITGGTFSENTATQGAAITLRGASTTMTLDGVTISGNTASNQGGAVRAYGANDLTIEDCTISGNKAQNGGGVYVNAGEILVEGGAISENEATDKGGAVYVAAASTTKLNGVTISGNKAKTYAGGIDVEASANVFMNACSVFGNSNTTDTASTRWGPAIFVRKISESTVETSANICINNTTFGEHTTYTTGSDTNIDLQGGNLVFANSTMIANTGAGMLRISDGAHNGTFINSVIVNKTGKSVNFNSTKNGGVLVSRYVISGVTQNSYNATADIDKAGVTYAYLGAPAFDTTDNIYKWDGTLTTNDCPAAPTTDVVSDLILTANADFHAWLTELGALDVDQLGNSRSTNRQGAYCGNN